jgi:oxalyl-CoA decarboxylase
MRDGRRTTTAAREGRALETTERINRSGATGATSELTDGFNLVVDALQLNGVETIYGVVGIPITDLARVAQGKGIRYLGFRHEQAAGHAAAAAGFLTQRPGICLTVSAPGFLNGLAALANATTNRFPMIQISGSSDRAIIDLQQGDYEELDQMAVARQLAKAAYRVERPEDIGVGVARAIRTAVSGRPGGVYLDLPASVLSATLEAQAGRQSLVEVVDPAPRQLAAPEAIDRALDLLAGAERPLIVIGKGAAYARAEDEIGRFIEATGIPFLPMSMAKGLLPDDHPGSVAAARSLALGRADVVMLVGARLNWLLGHGRSPQWSSDCRFVQVDISAQEMDSNRPIAAPLVGDIKSVVTQLLAALRPGQIAPSKAWLGDLATKKAHNIQKMAARLAADSVPMNFSVALGAVRDVLAGHPDTYIVNEGANTLDFGRDILSMSSPRHRLDPGTWGVMGVGMGYAIAAAVESGRPVVALEGDSAFGFSGMELETVCRYQLPIVTVIFNNGGVYKGDEANHQSSDPAPTVLSQSSRYEQLIEAFGGHGYLVEDTTLLAAALRKALNEGQPAVINCLIDPTAGTESGHLQKLNTDSSLSPAR